MPDEGISHEEDSEDSDSDNDEEFDEEELNELQNEADIDHFKAVLAHAQAMAVKAEREAAGEKPKRNACSGRVLGEQIAGHPQILSLSSLSGQVLRIM